MLNGFFYFFVKFLFFFSFLCGVVWNVASGSNMDLGLLIFILGL